ncbi:hypothetical protein B7486_08290 [cyanobacterium TDX16]|nr:hypothetical protein B7486_08290 [cyanobacterium TDX16]
MSLNLADYATSRRQRGLLTGRAIAAVSRIWRWEFWPMWLFYLPLLPWIAWLAVRHRGFTTPTAANPAIPHGGVVGEPKYEILRNLPTEWVVPSELIASGQPSDRFCALQRTIEARGWQYPIILKPDAGERGAGLKLVRSENDARVYLSRYPAPVIAQAYHTGPFEAGIFYYRIPGQEAGRIFSITDKHMPVLVGDGESTVRELIFRHTRFRMQANRFLSRLKGQADAVLPAGSPMRLAIAGNHCQGTMFCDGGHLITPQLESTVDQIARAFDGFYFGRFDVRYADVEQFKAGRGFSIIELNGVTSESTNIYDPSWSLLRAYSVLFRQWAVLFRIGAENRRRGHMVTNLKALAQEVIAYNRQKQADPVSD